jgi:formate dehydrogenase major subunit
MINLTIDGKPCQVPEGTTVLKAAQALGISIPTLCDHKKLIPYGGCRLCLVEVEGYRNLQNSCTFPAFDQMVVHTNNEKIHLARKEILNLIFSERNHFCPYCQISGGDCELQNAAYAEGMTNWTFPPNWIPEKVDASHNYFVIDHNRCILCRRCVRACGELVGNFTLTMVGRGGKTYLSADTDVSMAESSCVSCGTCLQVCPTGAIIDRGSAYYGLKANLDQNETICIGCSVGCGITLFTRDNNLLRIEGTWDAPVNDGVICKVGRFMPLDDQRTRLTSPLVRKNGQQIPVSWEEAMHIVADRLGLALKQKNSPVAALASTRIPAESLFMFRELMMHGLNSHMVTSIEEGQTTAVSTLLAEETGSFVESKLQAIQEADCIVTFGVNLVDNHPVVGFFVKRARSRGARLITIDIQENPFDQFANMILKPKPGTDAEMVLGLIAAIVQRGLGQAPVKIDAQATLSEAVAKTGISAEDFLHTAHIIAGSGKTVFVYGKGITANNGSSTLAALHQLANSIGDASSTYAGLISVKGEANSLAAAQYRLDVPFEVVNGQTVYLVMGDDWPSQRLMHRLENASFLIVQASYVSELTEKADVILPVEIWAEQEGHFINLEGRLQKTVRSLIPPDQVRSNAAILEDLAKRVGIEIDQERWKEALQERVSSVEIEL